MCLIHKWGKWEQYEVPSPARRITNKWGLCAAIEKRQRKLCQKCGKVKDELIAVQVLG
jgi:hypothetical protein